MDDRKKEYADQAKKKRLTPAEEAKWYEEDFKKNGEVYDGTDSKGRIIQLRPTPTPPGY